MDSATSDSSVKGLFPDKATAPAAVIPIAPRTKLLAVASPDSSSIISSTAKDSTKGAITSSVSVVATSSASIKSF